jgi:YbgC/YbaW family acyl-CoA thioester hydrolase
VAHTTELTVRFCELDPYGHVNHSVYVQYFEAGRVEALQDAGFGLDRLQSELGLTVVVVEIHTRFHAAAYLGDVLRVESGLSSVGRVKATWQQRIMRDDQLIASQEMVSGSLSIQGRPVRFPDEMVQGLDRYRIDAAW